MKFMAILLFLSLFHVNLLHLNPFILHIFTYELFQCGDYLYSMSQESSFVIAIAFEYAVTLTEEPTAEMLDEKGANFPKQKPEVNHFCLRCQS